MISRRSRITAAAFLMSASVLSACTSSRSAGRSPASGSLQVAEPNGKPIKLMVETGLTGPASNNPEIPAGARAAAKAINDAGGVADQKGGPNRPIDIVVCDDRNDPNAAADCGRRAVQDGVLAMVGNESVAGGTYVPFIEKAGIPVVGELALSRAELTSPLSFPLSNTFVFGYSLLTAARSLGSTGFVEVTNDLPAATSVLSQIFDFGRSIGLTHLSQTLIPPGATDYTPYAAKAAGSDGVIGIALSGANGAKFLDALISQGVDLKKRPVEILSDLFGTIDKLRGGAASADGLYASGIAWPATWTSEPGVRKYNSELDAIGDKSSPRDGLGAQAWVGVHLVADTLKHAPEITSGALVAGLKTAGSLHYSPLAPFDFSKPIVGSGSLSQVHTFSDAIMESRVVDGKLTPVVDDFVPVLKPFEILNR